MASYSGRGRNITGISSSAVDTNPALGAVLGNAGTVGVNVVGAGAADWADTDSEEANTAIIAARKFMVNARGAT